MVIEQRMAENDALEATTAPESAIGGAAGWRLRWYDHETRTYGYAFDDPTYPTEEVAAEEAKRLNAQHSATWRHRNT